MMISIDLNTYLTLNRITLSAKMMEKIFVLKKEHNQSESTNLS